MICDIVGATFGLLFSKASSMIKIIDMVRNNYKFCNFNMEIYDIKITPCG